MSCSQSARSSLQAKTHYPLRQPLQTRSDLKDKPVSNSQPLLRKECRTNASKPFPRGSSLSHKQSHSNFNHSSKRSSGIHRRHLGPLWKRSIRKVRRSTQTSWHSLYKSAPTDQTRPNTTKITQLTRLPSRTPSCSTPAQSKSHKTTNRSQNQIRNKSQAFLQLLGVCKILYLLAKSDRIATEINLISQTRLALKIRMLSLPRK